MEYIANKPHCALSLPAILSFGQFIAKVVDICKTGDLDPTTVNQLLSSANGFETVVLCIIMFVLKSKNKNKFNG